jgi:hypothetical protein
MSLAYLLWQKPYAQTCDENILLENLKIFCPYLHAGRGTAGEYIGKTAEEIRQIHIKYGYPSRRVNYIMKMYQIWIDLSMGDLVYIPCSSYDKKADKNLFYKVQIVGNPKDESINGLSALFRSVEILEAKVDIRLSKNIKRPAMALITIPIPKRFKITFNGARAPKDAK